MWDLWVYVHSHIALRGFCKEMLTKHWLQSYSGLQHISETLCWDGANTFYYNLYLQY